MPSMHGACIEEYRSSGELLTASGPPRRHANTYFPPFITDSDWVKLVIEFLCQFYLRYTTAKLVLTLILHPLRAHLSA